MELQGKVIAALPERSGTSARGEWKSQEFVIEYQESSYPRKLVFTVFGADRLARFNIQVGQDVRVAFDIDAHEWNGRWFADIRAFDVRPADAGAPMGMSDPFAAPQMQPAAAPMQQAAPAAQPIQSPAAAQPLTTPVEAAPGDADDNGGLPF